MAKLLDPREPVRFTPDDQAALDEGARKTYLLKVPTEWDRINLRKALAARGARQVGWLGLAKAMREIVEQAEGAAALAVLDSFIAAVEAWHAGPWESGDAERHKSEAFSAVRQAWLDLKPLADLCAAHSPAFASLRGDDAVFLEIYAIEAARIFLRGWEGPGLPPFARGVTGVPFDLLERLPPNHVAEISDEIQRLLRPSEAEAGNSVSPSPGDSAPTSSTSARSPAAADPVPSERDGTSPASAGRIS